MTPATIYKKTMAFNWYKLGLGILTIFVCAIVFGSTWFVTKQFASDLYENIGFWCGAFLIAVLVYYFIMIRQGYSIKIGHLAVIETAHRTEQMPENPIEYSKDVIKQRFKSSGKYYFFSRELTISTNQINRVIARGFSIDSETPNLKTSSRVVRLISMPTLFYVDECCMAYVLRKKDYEVNAACVDSLTILTQNWPAFMASALKTSLLIYGFLLFVTAIVFVPGYAICNMLTTSWVPWIGMSFLLALIFKIAFLDSYILTKMVCSFLEFADKTEIDRKNYIKLDHWSKAYAKFRKAAERAAEKAEDAEDKAEREAKKKLAAEKKAAADDLTKNADGSEGSAETKSESAEAKSEAQADASDSEG